MPQSSIFFSTSPALFERSFTKKPQIPTSSLIYYSGSSAFCFETGWQSTFCFHASTCFRYSSVIVIKELFPVVIMPAVLTQHSCVRQWRISKFPLLEIVFKNYCWTFFFPLVGKLVPSCTREVHFQGAWRLICTVAWGFGVFVGEGEDF